MVMDEKFVIKGKKPLQGEVEIRGYKNAIGTLCASLLTDKEVIIENIPLVEDCFAIIDILKDMGASIEWIGKRKIKIIAKNINPDAIDAEKFAKTRISVLLLGPLVARFGNFKIPHPGGDKIGLRPIDTHLIAFKKLGVEIKEQGDFYYFTTKKLLPTEIILKEFSVTATENIMLSACLIPGKTIIKLSACEPQVQNLGEMLIKMGADIKGLGTHTITIQGRKKLNGTTHRIISDPIETATFIIAGAITPGKVKVKNICLEHIDVFLDKLQDIGVNFKIDNKTSLTVDYSPNLRATKLQTFFYPGFPTDFLPFTSVLLTQAKGKSLIHDSLYENRFNHLNELRKMGADIEIVDPHRALIFGKTPLNGLTIDSWDIRAGASLVVAGLLAKGETTLKNIYQIDRGYEKIEERLQGLGANIQRKES